MRNPRRIVSAIATLAFVAGCETAATNQAASAASKKEALLTQADLNPKRSPRLSSNNK